MGNLLEITLEDGYDRDVLLMNMLEAGCTVRDVVRLGMTCTLARAWVCTQVAAFTRSQARALLRSCPMPSSSSSSDDHKHEFAVYAKYNSAHNAFIAWFIEQEVATHSTERRIMYCLPTEKKDVHPIGDLCGVFTGPNADLPLSTRAMQWYPMLDEALETCTGRWKVERYSKLMTRYAGTVRAAKRARHV